MAFLLPIPAPIIEPVNDITRIPNIQIQSDNFIGSTKAGIINITLIINGTYQDADGLLNMLQSNEFYLYLT